MGAEDVKSSRDFHESYYDHICAIIEEKDVLQTDIPGNTCTARLKRWWHGLFLLSYKDERSRIYYTSSHAIRMNRIRQYRKFRDRIHPLSDFRNFWDFIMMILFILQQFILHHNTSFLFGDLSRELHYVAATIELVIMLDVIVNMYTGYIDDEARKIVLGKRAGLLRYCSTKLFVHVASAVPIQWIMFLRIGYNFDCNICKINKFIATLKALSIFGLLRTYETTHYLTRKRRYFKVTHGFKFLRIAILGMMTMMQYIQLSDTFILMVMIKNNRIDDKPYISLLIRVKFASELHERPSNYTFFIFNFSRICTSILLFSFHFRRTKCHWDRIISLVAYLIANIFYMWTILECYYFISRIRFSEDRVIISKNTTNNLVQCRQLPDKVTRKINKFFDFNQSKIIALEQQNPLLKYLPMILKREIFLATYARFVMRIPYFSEWPTKMVEEITALLKEDIYLINDMVAEPWVQSEGLCIVAMGELAVYSAGDEETGHLIDGDYFGELSLVTDKEMRTSSIFALTPCMILVLDKSDFRTHMQKYPELFFAMKQLLKEKFGSKSAPYL